MELSTLILKKRKLYYKSMQKTCDFCGDPNCKPSPPKLCEECSELNCICAPCNCLFCGKEILNKTILNNYHISQHYNIVRCVICNAEYFLHEYITTPKSKTISFHLKKQHGITTAKHRELNILRRRGCRYCPNLDTWKSGKLTRAEEHNILLHEIGQHSHLILRKNLEQNYKQLLQNN